ncbi:MAG: nicotinate-nucleotide--dimethylbenzimidazole phosphoribosyltransferase [Bryobacterales bacterium]|nr:nicotinate-nucleotide--dimethylbenzimidazole phosphoribosyltransferase [Bryobacterales bacterium]
MRLYSINRTREQIAALAFPEALRARVEARWAGLTKPVGSLGQLEEAGTRYACIRNTAEPHLEKKAIYVFCGDHGVVAEGVSRYPQAVTMEMMRNFARGGAAINVLCQAHEMEAVIVDIGAAGATVEEVLDCRLANGTENFAKRPAMSRELAARAVETGIELAKEAAGRFDIVGLGEMGIGNSTSAAALLAAFAGLSGEEAAGRGTGLDDAGVARKARVIDEALALHQPCNLDALGVLAAVGGLEIAGIAGFILGAAAQRLPVMLDGFISCAGAVVAKELCPAALRTCLFSHESAEQGHRRMLSFLDVRPLLALDLRLGEGTGAVLGIHLVETAVRLLMEMATFDAAGVSRAE